MARETTRLLSEKEEWIAIDYARIFCVLLIVSIHLPVFASVDMFLSHYFNHVICRIAVPFFFISSGFFVADKIGVKGSYKYVCRVLTLYLVYNIIYIPQSLYGLALRHEDINYIFDTIKGLVVVGGYMQLWYLISLAFAVFALQLMVSRLRLNDKTIACLGAVLYLIGVIGNSYKEVLTSFDITLITHYYAFFGTMRNGLFFGIPFVAAGYLIKKNSFRIKNIGYLKWTIVFVICMLIESSVIYRYFNSGEKDMMFFTFPASVCFFLTVCFINQNKEKTEWIGKKCREYSVTIFGMHILVYFYLNRYLIDNGFYMSEHTVIQYILVISATLVLSAVIIEMSKYKPLRWMKVFY